MFEEQPNNFDLILISEKKRCVEYKETKTKERKDAILKSTYSAYHVHAHIQ